MPTVSYVEEREVSRIFDIGHWTFECPMSNIEYPANFTLFLYGGLCGVALLSRLNYTCQHEKDDNIYGMFTKCMMLSDVMKSVMWMCCVGFQFEYQQQVKFYNNHLFSQRTLFIQYLMTCGRHCYVYVFPCGTWISLYICIYIKTFHIKA